jgi:SHS2 domain-containing protein
LAAENGYYDILVSLLHSKYNDITKTYLNTTSLEIADFPKLAEKLSVIRTDMMILSDGKIFCRSEEKAPKNSRSFA